MILSVCLNLLSLVGAITLHEAAHGIVAHWFKDPTAKLAGRLTLNPLKHLDPLGSVILPGMLYLSQAPYLFGWAKPVPVDFSRLEPRRIGIICVALAGPFMNFILAWVSGLLLHTNPNAHTLGNDLLIQFLKTNVMLGIFNLLPLPPLDGGRVLVALLPAPLAISFSKTEPYTPLVLMGIMLTPLLFQGFDLFAFVLTPIYRLCLYMILGMSGHF